MPDGPPARARAGHREGAGARGPASRQKAPYELFDKATQAFIYNNQVNATQRMLDFDYVSGRRRRRWRRSSTRPAATASQVLLRHAGDPDPGLPQAAEGGRAAPERRRDDQLRVVPLGRGLDRRGPRHPADPHRGRHRRGRAGAPHEEITPRPSALGKVIIGPATVGGIKAGCFKIGNTGGTLENIVESKLHRPGSVGFVSKSGGPLQRGLLHHRHEHRRPVRGHRHRRRRLPRLDAARPPAALRADPRGQDARVPGRARRRGEYDVVEALEQGRITKPLVMWVTGTCAKAFKTEVQFGHAGAKVGSEAETADAKNAALRRAGAIVPGVLRRLRRSHPRDLPAAGGRGRHRAEARARRAGDPDGLRQGRQGRRHPQAGLVHQHHLRRPRRGADLRHVPISEVFERDLGVGGV
jgi:ATP-citrate lyase alpha-subunit